MHFPPSDISASSTPASHPLHERNPPESTSGGCFVGAREQAPDRALRWRPHRLAPMSDEREPAESFAAITSGVVSFLGAPYVRVEELAGRGARAAFLGFPFDGANAAIERPGSANGPRGLRICVQHVLPVVLRMGCRPVRGLWAGRLRRRPAGDRERRPDARADPGPPRGDSRGGGDPDRDRRRPLALHPRRPCAEPPARPAPAQGYLQLDAHLDAGVEIGGELQTNCNGLIRASELPNLSLENMAVIGIRGTINVRDWWDAVRDRG